MVAGFGPHVSQGIVEYGGLTVWRKTGAKSLHGNARCGMRDGTWRSHIRCQAACRGPAGKVPFEHSPADVQEAKRAGAFSAGQQAATGPSRFGRVRATASTAGVPARRRQRLPSRSGRPCRAWSVQRRLRSSWLGCQHVHGETQLEIIDDLGRYSTNIFFSIISGPYLVSSSCARVQSSSWLRV